MLISFLLRVCRKLDRILFGLRQRIWLKRMKRQAVFFGGNLIVDGGVLIACPIRCDGRGSVQMACDIKLGYRKAPRIGSGEILLQARRPESMISIGSKSAFSNNITIIANDSVAIGKNCLIGDMVTIYDSDFHELNPAMRHESSGLSRPVVIGDNVMLGSRVMVMKGGGVGDNSVIAAGAVVIGIIPPNVVAGGVPAKVIRSLGESSI